MALSLEYEVLLKLLSNSLFGTDYKFVQDINWDKVFEESVKQTVTAIAFDGLKDTKIPKEIKEKWLLFSMKILQNNHVVIRQHAILHKLLLENNIPYSILKGSASAFYYPNPSLRAMGDVDFYVPRKSFKKAIEVLLNDGFVTRGEKEDVHTVFRKDSIHLEMHFEPPGIPTSKMRSTIEEYFYGLEKFGKVDNIKGEEFYNPDKFQHGLILLLHTCHHILREGIGLRHLCDWAVFVNSFKGKDFANMFKSKLLKIGMWDFACILTLISVKFINMQLPEGVDTCFNRFDELIEDIFSSGNFGQKLKNRYFESLYLSYNGEGVSDDGKIRQFIKTINNIIFAKFKWLHKAQILLPVFWFFYGGRYFLRIISGKRRNILTKEIISSADHRRNIYKEFHVFESKNKK